VRVTSVFLYIRPVSLPPITRAVLLCTYTKSESARLRCSQGRSILLGSRYKLTTNAKGAARHDKAPVTHCGWAFGEGNRRLLSHSIPTTSTRNIFRGFLTKLWEICARLPDPALTS